MPDILIRGVNARSLARLKARAKSNGRSLQSEARIVLEQAAAPQHEDVAAIIEKWQAQWGDRQFSDSADLIREDRER